MHIGLGCSVMYPKSGILNRRVQLQSVSRVPDTNGIRSDAWTTYATVWAGIKYGGGREKQAGKSIVDVSSVTVEIRYRTGVKISDRILYGSQTFLINSIEDVDAAHARLVILCTEISSG